MSPVQLDTTEAATDTILYVVTLPAQVGDQSAITSTTTRTVIVEAAAPSIIPSDDASFPTRISIDGAIHVAASALAAEHGYGRDYIARLARQGHIEEPLGLPGYTGPDPAEAKRHQPFELGSANPAVHRTALPSAAANRHTQSASGCRVVAASF